MSTTTKGKPFRVVPPVHPGEYLAEEYMAPLGLSAYTLAARLDVPRTRIERLCKGLTGVSPDTALRLAQFFGTTPEFWMNLQALHDLTLAEQQAGAAIALITPLEAD